MRKGFWLLIFFILGAVLFYFTLRGVGIEGVVSILSMIRAWQTLLAIFILFTGIVIIGGYKWWMIIHLNKKEDAKLSRVMIAKFIGYSISYVTPSSLVGGEPAKVLYLKEETKLSTSRIISSIILDEIILFFLIIMVFFMGIFFLLIYMHLSWLAEIIGLGLMAGAISAILLIICKTRKMASGKGLFKTFAERFYLNKLKIIKQNMGALDEIERDIIKFFRRPKKELIEIFILAIMELSALLLAAWLILAFLGVRLDITRLFVVRSMTDVSGFFPLPASLGTLEISQAFVFVGLGMDSAVGVAFSLIWRGLNLIMAACGLIVFMFIQFGFLKKRIIVFIETLTDKIKK
ncbi:flippase-like domain-containing protein [Patescibacteria group bacterium]|nr:flippase-like domain-containing protein [Patescibacteria group bacterium]MBU4162191.1 flippase-like domain-containing protein [Patescibacteria group bacterium]